MTAFTSHIIHALCARVRMSLLWCGELYLPPDYCCWVRSRKTTEAKDWFWKNAVAGSLLYSVTIHRKNVQEKNSFFPTGWMLNPLWRFSDSNDNQAFAGTFMLASIRHHCFTSLLTLLQGQLPITEMLQQLLVAGSGKGQSCLLSSNTGPDVQRCINGAAH